MRPEKGSHSLEDGAKQATGIYLATDLERRNRFYNAIVATGIHNVENTLTSLSEKCVAADQSCHSLPALSFPPDFPVDSVPPKQKLEKLTRPELVDILKAAGLPTKGKKADPATMISEIPGRGS